MPSLSQLEALLAVAECGGFSGAAKMLYMSQPSVSNHIRNLESALGVRLVQRSTLGATTTTPAADVVEHARKVFDLLTNLRQQVADINGLQAGQLTVAGTTTPGTYLLPRLVAGFTARAPRIGCQIRVGNKETVEDWLLRGEVTIGLCAGQPDEEQLTAEPLLDEAMLLIAAAGSKLAGRTLHPRDLVGQRFLMREMGSATRRDQEAALRQWGLVTADQWNLWGTETLKEAVHAGLGLTVLSSNTTTRERKAETLVALTVDPPATSRTIYLVRRSDRLLTPAEEAFSAVAREIAAGPE